MLRFLERYQYPKTYRTAKNSMRREIGSKRDFRHPFYHEQWQGPEKDGLTKEFYVCFLEDLGSLLADTLNYAFQFSAQHLSETGCDSSDREKGPGQETYKELETNLSHKC